MSEAFRSVRVGSVVVKIAADSPVEINPPSSVPIKHGLGVERWTLGPATIGMMERVCLARYVAKPVVDELGDRWTEVEEQQRKLESSGGTLSPEEVITPIAQTVHASTRIEGEEVLAEDVPLAIVGKPDDREADQDDYAVRLRGTHDIYRAYLWALTRPVPLAGGGLVNREFIQELHRRMFFRTRSESAGRLKVKRNSVQSGDRVLIQMLAPDRVPEFLDRLCDRLNRQFHVADTSGHCSKILSAAEFLVDFLAIHPFADGNGRTARLLSTFFMERIGLRFVRFYPLDPVILDRHAEYYQVLLDSQRNWYTAEEDLSPWVRYYIDCIFEQWLRAHRVVSRQSA
jgi:Fic family protein